MNDVLKVTGLARSFTQGGVTIEVLRGVDLRVREGTNNSLLVAKYSSIVPCRSRWSRERFEKAATSNTIPFTLPIASAWAVWAIKSLARKSPALANS